MSVTVLCTHTCACVCTNHRRWWVWIDMAGWLAQLWHILEGSQIGHKKEKEHHLPMFRGLINVSPFTELSLYQLNCHPPRQVSPHCHPPHKLWSGPNGSRSSISLDEWGNNLKNSNSSQCRAAPQTGHPAEDSVRPAWQRQHESPTGPSYSEVSVPLITLVPRQGSGRATWHGLWGLTPSESPSGQGLRLHFNSFPGAAAAGGAHTQGSLYLASRGRAHQSFCSG